MTDHPLLTEIEDFLAKTGMGPSYFGAKAVGNSELVSRLRDGGDVRTATAARVREFIKSETSSGNAPLSEAAE